MVIIMNIEEIRNKILLGDSKLILKEIPSESIDCIITSPPYWNVRDYKEENQIGLEDHPQKYIDKIVDIMKECKRVLKPTGTIFLNLGDSFYTKSGSGQGSNFLKRYKQLDGGDGKLFKAHTHTREKYKSKWLQSKQRLLIPYRIAIKCQDELGLILRNDLTWVKQWTNWKTKESAGSTIPTSVQDRLNTNSESIFFFVKQKKYFFDLNAVRIPHKCEEVKPLSQSYLYQGKFKDNEQAESFGSPRARNYRNKTQKENYKIGMRNAPEPGEPNAFNPLGKNPGDCLMFPVEPSRENHFAIFPSTLPEFCILAGCPQYICPKCEKPRKKITNKNYIPTRPGLNTGNAKSGTDLDPNKSLHQRDISKYRMKIDYQIIAYTDCKCGQGFKPGIVLDPFMGSGTTAVIARKLGRDFVGIDLNSDYIEIAKKCLSKTEKPLI